MNLRTGPWGGGNQFGHSLVKYLENKGWEVFFNLNEPGLDLILLADPRPNSQTSTYTDKEIVRYLWRKNKKAIVVHRINECDERKGTTNVNKTLIRANYCADHTVFISSWLRDLFSGYGIQTSESSVILNGADQNIFYPGRENSWNDSQRLKLITHHWGAGYLKGFDIYERIDKMLEDPKFGTKIDFTYIGNLPNGFRFDNAKYVSPQSGSDLAVSLRSHHVYLTASQNEPAGMHHIEGAMCGLPLLYRESGALPEYCKGFGIPFTGDNFEQKLLEMIATYDKWVNKMSHYPHTAERMCAEYYRLFKDLLDRREALLGRRQWWRRPLWLAKAIVAKF